MINWGYSDKSIYLSSNIIQSLQRMAIDVDRVFIIMSYDTLCVLSRQTNHVNVLILTRDGNKCSKR